MNAGAVAGLLICGAGFKMNASGEIVELARDAFTIEYRKVPK